MKDASFGTALYRLKILHHYTPNVGQWAIRDCCRWMLEVPRGCQNRYGPVRASLSTLTKLPFHVPHYETDREQIRHGGQPADLD